MSYVSLGIEHFINPVNGKPVSNGSIFIGEPDTDPEIVSNQKIVSARLEDGSYVELAQPIRTGGSGVPLYNGSPVRLITNGEYSIKVLDAQGGQDYYVAFGPSMTDPDSTPDLLTEIQLRRAADANLQAQISGGTPLEASAFSEISWHGQIIENSVTIPDNKNAWSFGPTMTIAPAALVTVGTGSFWTIANGEVTT